MRGLVALVVLILSTATAALAQEHTVVVEQTMPAFALPRATPDGKTFDRKFWMVTAALNAAMLGDTKSTFDVVKACRACSEANPIVAPFVRRGPVVTFTAGEVFDAGVMSMAARMKASERTWVRRTWWVVPAALGVGHVVAMRHNYALLK